ncbi:hypothetical protein HHK36_008275 [Tetracentron sinense]|uniref:Uncharacterized protein n=1 Tax=Tetracentron sinense TaxID=13715 RepID=A0A834ZF44_TETSI|nr:hypothetical protein HHK36_008275 [Tetracentron sinense]
MGNCQAAEAATVVIQHPGIKTERIYWSVSAHEVMNSNPGHYVALVLTSPSPKSDNGTPVKQLKLLRPDDTLHIGQVYRLISFEEVLKEFAAKKSVKLGKLLKERGTIGGEKKRDRGGSKPESESESESESETSSLVKVEQEVVRSRRHHGGGGQWRPALQSIAEIGT